MNVRWRKREEVRALQMVLPEWTQPWPDYLDKYEAVFSKESYKRLPEHCSWDHAIDLKADFTPTDCKIYPLNPKQNEALK